VRLATVLSLVLCSVSFVANRIWTMLVIWFPLGTPLQIRKRTQKKSIGKSNQ